MILLESTEHDCTAPIAYCNTSLRSRRQRRHCEPRGANRSLDSRKYSKQSEPGHFYVISAKIVKYWCVNWELIVPIEGLHKLIVPVQGFTKCLTNQNLDFFKHMINLFAFLNMPHINCKVGLGYIAVH